MKVIIPVPAKDFDPTETAIPWKILRKQGIEVAFASPEGKAAAADIRLLTGQGFGPFRSLLMADTDSLEAYKDMERSEAFQKPMRWDQIQSRDFSAILLPGGHAKGIRDYLESQILQTQIAEFFADNKVIGAICHGVVLVARSKNADGHSVLRGRKTTGLLKSQELSAWALTKLWLGDYYRTYPEPVQTELTRHLGGAQYFQTGPLPVCRDSINALHKGFIVEDKNYISARWPGDAHRFGAAVARAILRQSLASMRRCDHFANSVG